MSSTYSGYDRKHARGIPPINTSTPKALEQVLADAAELDRINAEARQRFGLPPVPVVKPVINEVKAERTGVAGRGNAHLMRRFEPRAPEVEVRELAEILFGPNAPRGLRRAVIRQAKVSSSTVYQLQNGRYDGLGVSAVQCGRAMLAAGWQKGREGRPKGWRKSKLEACAA
jgi:hypothetical protein